MGKYTRKAKISGDVVIMEVSQSSLGVRTRARTLALQSLQNTNTSSTSASYLQLRSRRLDKPLVIDQTNPRKPKERCKENPITTSSLESSSVNYSTVGSVSLSSSKEKGGGAASVMGILENREAIIEVSVEENVLESEGRERNDRETTPSSLIMNSENLGAPGSTTRQNRRIQNMMRRIIPTAQEIEEFFTSAEQEQHRIFVEKYNFDPVCDLPLPGRYEWVRMNS